MVVNVELLVVEVVVGVVVVVVVMFVLVLEVEAGVVVLVLVLVVLVVTLHTAIPSPHVYGFVEPICPHSPRHDPPMPQQLGIPWLLAPHWTHSGSVRVVLALVPVITVDVVLLVDVVKVGVVEAALGLVVENAVVLGLAVVEDAV